MLGNTKKESNCENGCNAKTIRLKVDRGLALYRLKVDGGLALYRTHASKEVHQKNTGKRLH